MFHVGQLILGYQLLLIFNFPARVDRLMAFPELVIPHALPRHDSGQILRSTLAWL